MDTVKDLAAVEAQDAASHGYNGRDGAGAELLKLTARAVRIAARQVERGYGVPIISADERAEYAGDLAAWLIGRNGGKLPAPGSVALAYVVRRAAGLILNDRARHGLDLTQPSQADAGADPRLDGPLTIPAEIESAADYLELSETGRRAFIAAIVPATRQEWAELYGYANPDTWHRTAKRGRVELRTIGEDALRQALQRAEAEAENAERDISRGSEHDE